MQSTKLKIPSKEQMKYTPNFPIAERDARWEKTRKAMEHEGIDCLVIWGSDRCYGTASANMRYLLGVVPESMSGGIGILPIDGDSIAWLDYPNYYKPYPAHLSYQEWTKDIRPVAGMKPIAKEMERLGYKESKIGLVSHYMASMIDQQPYIVPHYDVEALKEFMPKAKIAEATKLVDDIRMIKSPAEVKMLERSGQIANKMVSALVETAKPGVRENEVFAKMAYTMLAEGGEGYLFNQLASGSIDDEWHHLLHGKGLPLGPTTRPLGNSDIVITEFHSNYGGYLVGVEFTALVGSYNEKIQYLHDIAVESLKKLLGKMTPNTTLREVIETMRAPVLEAGLKYIELGFHGHGLSSPEFPTYVYSDDWPYEAGEGINDYRLKENTAFGINIDIHDPKWRDDVGIMFGDTVLVGHPPKLLGNVPLTLPVCK